MLLYDIKDTGGAHIYVQRDNRNCGEEKDSCLMNREENGFVLFTWYWPVVSGWELIRFLSQISRLY
jgi:hypothetical protein